MAQLNPEEQSRLDFLEAQESRTDEEEGEFKTLSDKQKAS